MSQQLAALGQHAEALTHAQLALRYNPDDKIAKKLVESLPSQMAKPMRP